MNPADVNGIVQGDRPQPVPLPSIPADNGQIQTADFQASGNLRMLYLHLKDTYEPKVQSQSGPIKRVTDAELKRDKHKDQEEFVNSL